MVISMYCEGLPFFGHPVPSFPFVGNDDDECSSILCVVGLKCTLHCPFVSCGASHAVCRNLAIMRDPYS